MLFIKELSFALIRVTLSGWSGIHPETHNLPAKGYGEIVLDKLFGDIFLNPLKQYKAKGEEKPPRKSPLEAIHLEAILVRLIKENVMVPFYRGF